MFGFSFRKRSKKRPTLGRRDSGGLRTEDRRYRGSARRKRSAKKLDTSRKRKSARS